MGQEHFEPASQIICEPVSRSVIGRLSFGPLWFRSETNGNTPPLSPLNRPCVPGWLLYPVVLDFLIYKRGCVWLLALTLAMAPTLATGLVAIQNGFELTSAQHFWLYLWPPAMLPDFCLGCVAAEIAARYKGPSLRFGQCLA